MNTSRKNQFTFIDGLQLLFIGLKLRGDIDWPWALVMLPLGGLLALTIVAMVVKGGEE